MSDFFKRLIYTRLSMNLSKKEFGELGGVSDVSQGRYEEEDAEKRRFPDVQYLINLENHGIDISYLLTGKSSSNNLDADESLLLETFRNNNEQSKKLMLDLCRTLSGLPNKEEKQEKSRSFENVAQYSEKEITNHNPLFDQSKKKL